MFVLLKVMFMFVCLKRLVSFQNFGLWYVNVAHFLFSSFVVPMSALFCICVFSLAMCVYHIARLKTQIHTTGQKSEIHVKEDQYIILMYAKTTGVPICQMIQHYLANHVMPILAVCHVNPTIYLNHGKMNMLP